MPKIRMVAGVRIIIWPNDHIPAHVHCFYNGQECRLAILTGDVISGELERAKLKAVRAWLTVHRERVAFAWKETMSGREFRGLIK